MLKPQDVQWVAYMGDPAYKPELGVKIGDQVFTLCKGESMVQVDGFWRPLDEQELADVIKLDPLTPDSEAWARVNRSNTSDDPLYVQGIEAWVVVGEEWGGDEYTESEELAACERATAWCASHSDPQLAITITFRPAKLGEEPGFYQVCPRGSLRATSEPYPDAVRVLTNRAWLHACDTWPGSDNE